MNKQELLQLEALSNLTPAEIEKKHPAIYAKLTEKASAVLKSHVESALKDAPKALKDGLSKLDFTAAKLGTSKIKTLLSSAVISPNLSAEKKKEAEAALSVLPKLGKLHDVLQPDLPIEVNPSYRAELDKAKLYRLGELAGITDAKTEKILALNLSADLLNEDKLGELVKDKLITDTEAGQLGLATNLHTLTDGSNELTQYLKKNASVNTITDLVRFDRADWQKFIKDSKMKLPEGATAEETAETLFKRTEALLPEDALNYRMNKADMGALPGLLEQVKPLQDKNEKSFGIVAFEDLNTEGITAAQLRKLKPAYDQVYYLANAYPGLQLHAIINDKNNDAVTKGRLVAERTGLMGRFLKNNPGLSYLTMNYTHDSQDVDHLNFQGFSAEEKTMVLKSVKAYQRVYSFSGDIETTEKVVTSGYHSAYQIAAVTFDQFIATTRMDKEKGGLIYENAHHTIIRTTGIMGSVLDYISGSFNWTNVGNASPAIKDYLRQIPGYQDLFGELAFCDCEHCQSIYSPAAYFVDMMEFTQQYVTSKYFTGANTNHVLNLKVRRPDLWTLPLTCENTNTLVPYLEIINEILETYIAKHKGYAGDLGNRAAVQEFVYKKEIALEKPGAWKNNVHTFRQPFHLPATSVATYLSHFEKTREDAAQLIGKNQELLSKLRLDISDKENQLITVADSSEAFIKRVFGIDFGTTGGKITPFDAQLLLKSIGVSRKELGRLLKCRYITQDGAEAITIHGEKKTSDSIQNDIERVKNLTWASLDRIHRFVRLWRKTGWTPEELDLVLSQLKTSGVGNDISPAVVTAIGHLHRLQAHLRLSVEELCSLTYRIPDVVLKENEDSIFDRLFNHEDAVAAEGAYPKNTTRFIHPALVIDQSTSPGEFSSGRLMAAFNLSDDELLVLIKKLATPLGIANLSSVTESDRGFLLTTANLSLLYRHALMANLLKSDVTDLFRFISLANLPNGYMENSTQINAVIDLHSWWKTTGLNLDDIFYIIESTNISEPANYPSKNDITDYLLSQTTSTNALLFADTLFAFFDDVTEEQSKAIIAANAAVMELSPDGINYWLKPAFNPSAPIIVPTGVSRAEAELRTLLLSYHPQYLVPFMLSGQLGLSEIAISDILLGLGINLDADTYTLELQGASTPAATLTALVEKLLPLSVLFRDKKFNAEAIHYVVGHPGIFNIASLDTINLAAIQNLYTLRKFIVINEDATSNVSTLAEVLGSFVQATQYATADQDKLAAVLQSKPELLATLHPVAVSNSHAITALAHYSSLADFCAYIGIGGNVLPLIASQDYAQLVTATNALLGAFRSKYKSESERKEKLEKYDDLLRSRKRSSLTDYLIHSGFPQFTEENDLFHYFLIDTELEGCARTSRLVAATMSLQLYLHRILLNLEQDQQEPGTPGRIHVPASAIPADEWEWRKNYRVWEANRKVFLYPENYIEPDLRDDKTPLFKELENELLQQEINADTVLDAYAKYMRGFDEVAHLKIAGAYHEKDSATETDVLHLFGVSSAEPPAYYYRRVENIYYSEKNDNRGVVWGPWQSIGVQIPVRQVAPIMYNGRLHVFWVNITTLTNSVFDNNRSVFTGYSHKFSIEFTTLKLDGTWTPPQKLSLNDNYPFAGNGVLQDPLADDEERENFMNQLSDILRSFPFFNFGALSDEIIALKTPRYALSPHYEPVDEYTLRGYLWNHVYPANRNQRLVLTGVGYQMRSYIDFYDLGTEESGGVIGPGREMMAFNFDTPGKMVVRDGTTLYRGKSPVALLMDNFAYTSLMVNGHKSDTLLQRHMSPWNLNICFDNVNQESIANLRNGTRISIINGAYSDAILDVQGDLLLLQGTPLDGNGFLLRRLGTELSETLTRTLFTSGVDTMLNIVTQKTLKEPVAPITIRDGKIENNVVKDKIDFTGPYGNYYREIFFHIPYLLANHLNSQGKYAEAQKWYHYIFNPTATEVIDFSDPNLTAAQKRKLELDRNWQYIEFRNLDVPKLRDQLNDKKAIEMYKKDPFNPHAIARLRLSAYQKNIVMKYIDNLLDWGDQLFTRDTMESVNEATLLYIVAKEILGSRPAEIGSCGEGKVNPKTYANIAPLLDKGSEFLAELETYTIVSTPSKGKKKRGAIYLDNDYVASNKRKTDSRQKAKRVGAQMTMGNSEMIAGAVSNPRVSDKLKANNPIVKEIRDEVTGAFAVGTVRGLEWKKGSIYVDNKYGLPSFGKALLKQVSPVFCVPGNKDLLAYYDRVDDRLFKIRNCMNILGQKRQLALFAPEIDPRLLVRAKAAGLSLDDILNSTNGNLPPYRFAYILDRAKSFTATVQGFGASLLAAIEKKNGEELSMLRLTQQQHILELSSKTRKLEINAAIEAIKTIQDRIDSITYQIGYYDSLIAENRNGWEIAQSIGRHTASVATGVALPLWSISGVLGLVPQVGSPFAMKYGGVELSNGAKGFALAVETAAALGEALSASAGLEAGFDRRSEGWKHQRKLLQYELTQTKRNLTAAEIRRDIMIEAEKIHQKNIAQVEEMLELYGDKFTSLGLYTWLSTTMQRIYKEAFNNAVSISRLAEQAYRYERDDNSIFIDGNYFDSSRAGLLAGERLLMALQTMERRYLETNYRKNEIDQAFSLTQISPAALMLLRQTGSCEFSVPEVFYDLFYPGHYKRKIQSVRLTIPSITGPYTNVSATLSLMSSKIRMEAKLGAAELKDVPKSRTTSIATSTAQNDAGVFQLNFRDDRYMPFEGAGAISAWKLSMPKNFRQFDYNTINDVIIHISYTAEYDELFRDKVEADNDATEGTLINILKNNVLSRTFSLRQEFSSDFHRLTDQPVNQAVVMKIQNKHFPLFMNGRNLKVANAKLVLVTPPGQTVAGFKVSINGTEQSGFLKDAAVGDLYAKDLGNLFNAGIQKEHTLIITAGGDLAPENPPPGPVSAVDADKLMDMILYIEYQIG